MDIGRWTGGQWQMEGGQGDDEDSGRRTVDDGPWKMDDGQ